MSKVAGESEWPLQSTENRSCEKLAQLTLQAVGCLVIRARAASGCVSTSLSRCLGLDVVERQLAIRWEGGRKGLRERGLPRA